MVVVEYLKGVQSKNPEVQGIAERQTDQQRQRQRQRQRDREMETQRHRDIET